MDAATSGAGHRDPTGRCRPLRPAAGAAHPRIAPTGGTGEDSTPRAPSPSADTRPAPRCSPTTGPRACAHDASWSRSSASTPGGRIRREAAEGGIERSKSAPSVSATLPINASNTAGGGSVTQPQNQATEPRWHNSAMYRERPSIVPGGIVWSSVSTGAGTRIPPRRLHGLLVGRARDLDRRARHACPRVRSTRRFDDDGSALRARLRTPGARRARRRVYGSARSARGGVDTGAGSRDHGSPGRERNTGREARNARDARVRTGRWRCRAHRARRRPRACWATTAPRSRIASD